MHVYQWLVVSASVLLSLSLPLYLLTSCVEDKGFLPYSNFKALLLKAEPHKQQHVLSPHPLLSISFSSTSGFGRSLQEYLLCVLQRQLQKKSRW